MKVFKTVGKIFIPIGIILLAVAIASYINTHSFLSSGGKAEGTVIRLEKVGGRGGYRPVVVFSTASGRRVEFASSVSTTPPSYTRGESVTVVYDPEDPATARIGSFFQIWWLTGLFIFLALDFLVMGSIFYYLAVRRSRHAVWLRQFGREVEARVDAARPNRSIRVNGRHPYRIYCHYRDPRTGEKTDYKSDNLWFDFDQVTIPERIRVLIDPRRPSRYLVDSSFLDVEDRDSNS